MTVTVVSALLTNVNEYRSVDKYIEYGKQLISIPINKVIYVEQYIYDTYFKNWEYDEKYTVFRITEKKDNYLYEYLDKLPNFNLNTGNPGKDTIEYMFVQCNKTEWVRNAILENPYATDQFIWLDFGIRHMFSSDEEFTRQVLSLNSKSYLEVRIAKGACYPRDIYTSIVWYFLGTVFGGHKDELIRFADKMKEKCLSVMNEKGTICWEINLWYLISNEYPELFNGYVADHNNSIVANY